MEEGSSGYFVVTEGLCPSVPYARSNAPARRCSSSPRQRRQGAYPSAKTWQAHAPCAITTGSTTGGMALALRPVSRHIAEPMCSAKPCHVSTDTKVAPTPHSMVLRDVFTRDVKPGLGLATMRADPRQFHSANLGTSSRTGMRLSKACDAKGERTGVRSSRSVWQAACARSSCKALSWEECLQSANAGVSMQALPKPGIWLGWFMVKSLTASSCGPWNHRLSPSEQDTGNQVSSRLPAFSLSPWHVNAILEDSLRQTKASVGWPRQKRPLKLRDARLRFTRLRGPQPVVKALVASPREAALPACDS